jgi:hypothetical protein
MEIKCEPCGPHAPDLWDAWIVDGVSGCRIYGICGMGLSRREALAELADSLHNLVNQAEWMRSHHED